MESRRPRVSPQGSLSSLPPGSHYMKGRSSPFHPKESLALVPGRDRERLEQLCRYVGRPVLATERLSELIHPENAILVESRPHVEVCPQPWNVPAGRRDKLAVSAGAIQQLGWRGWHDSPYGAPDNLSAGVLRRVCQFRSAGRWRVPRRDDPEPGTSVLLPARLVGLAAAGGPARSELGLPRMGIPDSSVAGAAVPSRNRWRGNRAQRRRWCTAPGPPRVPGV